MFSKYIRDWGLIATGPAIQTASSHLLPVLSHDQHAMLKVVVNEEERPGLALMAWWKGNGAAQVFAHDSNAILLERAQGENSLIELCHSGQDDQACNIICSVIAKLHEPHPGNPPELTPLPIWFQGLAAAATTQGGILQTAHTTALKLLAQPHDVRPLHGDIHHFNILDFGPQGWLTIDPKGLLGERGFDYANLFCNPDLETAGDVSRFIARVDQVARIAHLERQRLLQWVLAWAGLSAAWHLEDGTPADTALKVATMAAAELDV